MYMYVHICMPITHLYIQSDYIQRCEDIVGMHDID